MEIGEIEKTEETEKHNRLVAPALGNSGTDAGAGAQENADLDAVPGQGESSGLGAADGSGLLTDVARGESGGSDPSALIAPPLPLARSYHSTRFRPGDLVSWMGIHGKVIEEFKTMRSSDSAALVVEFEEKTQDFGGTSGFQRMRFLRDGRLLCWHLEPSLKMRK